MKVKCVFCGNPALHRANRRFQACTCCFKMARLIREKVYHTAWLTGKQKGVLSERSRIKRLVRRREWVSWAVDENYGGRVDLDESINELLKMVQVKR